MARELESTSTSYTTSVGYYYQWFDGDATCNSWYAANCYETWYPLNQCIYTTDDYGTWRYAAMTQPSPSTARITMYGTTDMFCSGSVFGSWDYVINSCSSTTSSGYYVSEMVTNQHDRYCSGADSVSATAALAITLIAAFKNMF